MIRRVWAPLVLVVLAAVIFVVWRSAPVDANDQALPAADAGSAPAPPTAAAVGRPASSDATTPPSGVTAEQWQSLLDSLASHPDRDREMARIAAYFEYRQAVQALRSGPHDTASTEALRDAARRVDAGLADRIAQGEVTAGEALALKQAALDVLEPDASRRAQAIAQWRATQAPARINGDARDDDANRNARFRERQAALIAAHRALPASQRDPARLAEQLQALRTEIFDAPQPPAR